MKKSFNIVILSMLLAASCQTEVHPDTPDTRIIFTAESEAGTRTVLNNTSVLWESRDQIRILWGNNESCSAKATPSNGNTRAEFEALVGSADAYYAVYPYSATSALSDGCISVDIPSEQSGVFDDVNFAVARADSKNTFSFRHICGYLEFTLDKTGVVEISGADNDAVTGKVVVNGFDEVGVPQYTTESISSRVVVRVPSSGTYHVALLPEARLSFLSVTLEDGEKYEYALSTNEIQMSRAKLVSLGNITGRLNVKRPVGATLESFTITEFSFE